MAGIGVGHEAVALGRQQRGVEQHGNDPAASRAKHAHEEVRRRRQAERDPVPGTEARRLERARHPPLGVLGRTGLEDLEGAGPDRLRGGGRRDASRPAGAPSAPDHRRWPMAPQTIEGDEQIAPRSTTGDHDGEKHARTQT